MVGGGKSVLRGRARRMRPMAFSMPPFCQGHGYRRRRFGYRSFEAVVLGELGAVVEGDGLAQLGQGLNQAMSWRRWVGGFVWLSARMRIRERSWATRMAWP